MRWAHPEAADRTSRSGLPMSWFTAESSPAKAACPARTRRARGGETSAFMPRVACGAPNPRASSSSVGRAALRAVVSISQRPPGTGATAATSRCTPTPRGTGRGLHTALTRALPATEIGGWPSERTQPRRACIPFSSRPRNSSARRALQARRGPTAPAARGPRGVRVRLELRCLPAAERGVPEEPGVTLRTQRDPRGATRATAAPLPSKRGSRGARAVSGAWAPVERAGRAGPEAMGGTTPRRGPTWVRTVTVELAGPEERVRAEPAVRGGRAPMDRRRGWEEWAV